MSDYPDFEDIWSKPQKRVAIGEALALMMFIGMQRLMDRLKAIEAKVDLLSKMGVAEVLRDESGNVTGIVFKPITTDGFTPPLAPATFRGHPVKTPEEIDSIGLPTETEEEEDKP